MSSCPAALSTWILPSSSMPLLVTLFPPKQQWDQAVVTLLRSHS